MPMYEFKCAKCGDVFEELVRNSQDDNDVQCPRCGSHDIGRVLSSFAVSTGSSGGSCGGSGGFS